jgi:uncharacterized protein YkwD
MAIVDGRGRTPAPLAALLALAIIAVTASAARRAPVRPAPVGEISMDSALAAEAARLVNEHRSRAGCLPLAWDAAAARAAQAHSDDMVRRDYFDDVSPEGRAAGDRLRAAGARWTAVAENIASGASSPDAVVQGWLGSPEHRGNLENCIYTRHGVGHRDTVWTHVLYLPR